MYEVFSFGDKVPLSFGLKRKLGKTYGLPQPSGCPDEIYNVSYVLFMFVVLALCICKTTVISNSQICTNIFQVMTLCWQQDPNNRPSFDELLPMLNGMYGAGLDQNLLQWSCSASNKNEHIPNKQIEIILVIKLIQVDMLPMKKGNFGHSIYSAKCKKTCLNLQTFRTQYMHNMTKMNICTKANYTHIVHNQRTKIH